MKTWKNRCLVNLEKSCANTLMYQTVLLQYFCDIHIAVLFHCNISSPMSVLFCVAVPLGIIIVLRDADLETVREQINRLGKDMLVSTNNNTSSDSQSMSDKETGTGISSEVPPPPSIQPLSPKWCFLDCEY